MGVSLKDVVTQYTVLDKALLDLYDTNKGKWGYDIELKSVKSRHRRFEIGRASCRERV